MTGLLPRGTIAGSVDGTGEDRLQILVATAAVFCLPLHLDLFKGLTVSAVVSLLLLLVWTKSALAYRGYPAFLALGLAAIASGLLLMVLSTRTHEVDARNASAQTFLLVELIAGVGVLLWARRIIPPWVIGLTFAIGLAANELVTRGSLPAANPWKNLYVLPVAIALLGLSSRARSWAADAAVLLFLAAFSGLNDSRSYAASFVIALVLRLWQARPRRLSRRASGAWTVATFGLAVIAVYELVQSLLVGGLLGEQSQQRTIAQIDASGSLLLGGRPELAATLSLFRNDVWGHGVGVLASYHDVLVAKTGMVAINYDPFNGYVDRYMFGDGIELHSLIGDLWVRWGLLGLVFLGAVVVLIARSTISILIDRQGSGLALFAISWTAWNLFFSPLYSSLPTLMLAIGLALVPALRVRPSTPATDDARTTSAARSS